MKAALRLLLLLLKPERLYWGVAVAATVIPRHDKAMAVPKVVTVGPKLLYVEISCCFEW